MKRIVRALAWTSVCATALLLLSPAIFYAVGLARIPSYPVPPTTMHGNSRLDGAGWDAYGGWGPHGEKYGQRMKLARLDPWSYAYHNLVRCKRGGGSGALHACVYYYPGWMAAYAVAYRHLRHDQQDEPPSFWSELPVVSLAIWITRHWTAPEIDAYMIRSDENGV